MLLLRLRYQTLYSLHFEAINVFAKVDMTTYSRKQGRLMSTSNKLERGDTDPSKEKYLVCKHCGIVAMRSWHETHAWVICTSCLPLRVTVLKGELPWYFWPGAVASGIIGIFLILVSGR